MGHSVRIKLATVVIEFEIGLLHIVYRVSIKLSMRRLKMWNTQRALNEMVREAGSLITAPLEVIMVFEYRFFSLNAMSLQGVKVHDFP